MANIHENLVGEFYSRKAWNHVSPFISTGRYDDKNMHDKVIVLRPEIKFSPLHCIASAFR